MFVKGLQSISFKLWYFLKQSFPTALYSSREVSYIRCSCSWVFCITLLISATCIYPGNLSSNLSTSGSKEKLNIQKQIIVRVPQKFPVKHLL